VNTPICTFSRNGTVAYSPYSLLGFNNFQFINFEDNLFLFKNRIFYNCRPRPKKFLANFPQSHEKYNNFANQTNTRHFHTETSMPTVNTDKPFAKIIQPFFPHFAVYFLIFIYFYWHFACKKQSAYSSKEKSLRCNSLYVRILVTQPVRIMGGALLVVERKSKTNFKKEHAEARGLYSGDLELLEPMRVFQVYG
jgi:hypothetical protein